MPKKNGDYESVPKAESKADPDEPFQVQAMPPMSVLLNPLAWILWIIDFLVWSLCCCCCCCGPCKALKFCIKRVGLKSYADPEDDDESIRRRFKDNWENGLLTKAFEDEWDAPTTVWEMAQRSFREYADKDAFGTRKFIKNYKKEGEKFSKAVFGETEWTTYGEAEGDVLRIGAGLRELGMQPVPHGGNLEQLPGPHTLLLFEDTCQEWTTTVLAAHSQSLVVATSYSTLGIQAVCDAIQECNVSVLVCNRKNVQEILEVAPAVLKTVVYTDHYVSPEEAATPLAMSSRCRLMSYSQLMALGAQSQQIYPPTPPAPENLAVIMYTSGSTGKPKGVMITHRAIIASIATFPKVLPYKAGNETYVGYLPAAHIFEFCAEMSNLLTGNAIGYADTKTITSKGAIRQRDDGTYNEAPGWPDPPGGIQEFKPTFMVAVPVVWDTFKKTIEDGVGQKSALVKFLFQTAYSGAYFARRHGRTCPLLNLLVFKSVQSMIGGRLKFGISGGGPISADVQEFMSIVGGFPLIQGYALTESCCAGTCCDVDEIDTGLVGGPMPSVELKLRSCDGPEDPKDRDGCPYLAEDDEHLGTPCFGRGEVCIRGPSMSSGYFKQPDKTREAWPEGLPSGTDPEYGGWFRSGDIAYWDTKGRLHIVDRLKNLVKLKGGEYIAMENMEKEYSTSPFVRSGVSGGVMCYGDGDLRRPVALVQANMAELKKWAQGSGLGHLDDDALCADPKARSAVLDSLNKAGKGKLSKNEGLVAVGLISGNGPAEGTPAANSPWAPENGGRTASNKLDRKAILKMHPALMEELKKAGA
jgi:long-chain acyl-CoA synthetase